MRYNNEQYSKSNSIESNSNKVVYNCEKISRRDKIRYDMVRRAHTTSCL